MVSFLVTLLLGLHVMNTLDTAPASPTPAVYSEPAAINPDMTGFDAERIIDDEVFYDSTTMTAAEITSFINTVNEDCQTGADGTPCLAEAAFDTEDREATTACPGGYAAARAETAAQIISQVATSCDINPRVLLVLLHKEQGLLTASGASLTARRYEAATGYACPDGQECDAEYAGFFRQVYGAASQFQNYRLDPDGFQVVAGTTTRLAYSPNSMCGDGELTVANQATAGLYNYTPFQANAAAASGGDECTSWGNWNFYGYYRALFGDPTPSTAD
ncbi:hemagglutinin [Actinomyces qiguomingii]|uniref:hemagglutinin n=1 Tax=Actinomyces qiguomingii TaxID=2057800 RepID=UPI001E59A4AC|nr:hemagglutinin [Actinomyces qiguomingii]